MDYYGILGLNKSATPRDIKRAYNKLALKYHPDKNSSSNAQKKFQSIKEAYEILKDEKKRSHHDQSNRYKPRDAKRVYEEELAKIRKLNIDKLESVNVARQQQNHQKSSMSSKSDLKDIFYGEIMKELSDDDYEKIVLDRLRSMS